MTRERVLEIFRTSGALLEGRFILRSGLRSREFFLCAPALQKMPEVEGLGAGLLVVDRSNGGYDPGVPFLSLLPVKVETFEPDNLPADPAAISAVKSGGK